MPKFWIKNIQPVYTYVLNIYLYMYKPHIHSIPELVGTETSYLYPNQPRWIGKFYQYPHVYLLNENKFLLVRDRISLISIGYIWQNGMIRHHEPCSDTKAAVDLEESDLDVPGSLKGRLEVQIGARVPDGVKPKNANSHQWIKE